MEIPKIPGEILEKLDNIKKEEPIGKSSTKVQKSYIKENDKITLSSEGKLIFKLRKIYDELPDVKESKVSELKEKIENNAYNLSPEEIVTTILSGKLFRI